MVSTITLMKGKMVTGMPLREHRDRVHRMGMEGGKRKGKNILRKESFFLQVLKVIPFVMMKEV